MNGIKGFTMVELMIVVVIIAIISTVAYPSYVGHIKRSNRVTAQGDLYAYRNAMQRFFADNNTYMGAAVAGANSGTPDPNVFPPTSPVSSSDISYNLTYVASAGPPMSFILTATPAGVQSSDKCGTLTLNDTNVKTVSMSTVAKCWK